MASTPRFHVDESVTPEVANGLRRRGWDCTTSQEQELLGAADAEQLAFAVREHRILITADQDFLRFAKGGTQHAGIVFWTGTRHFGQLIAAIDELCFSVPAEQWPGSIRFL